MMQSELKELAAALSKVQGTHKDHAKQSGFDLEWLQ